MTKYSPLYVYTAKLCHPCATFFFVVFEAFGERKKPQDIIDFYTYPRTPGMYVCVGAGGRPFFERVHASLCLRRGASCVIYSSVVVRCEKDDESFRLPFSNRLDSTGRQAKGKLLYGASAPCPIDLYASLLIENHRIRFSFRSTAPIALLSKNNTQNHLSLIINNKMPRKVLSKSLIIFSLLIVKENNKNP